MKKYFTFSRILAAALAVGSFSQSSLAASTVDTDSEPISKKEKEMDALVKTVVKLAYKLEKKHGALKKIKKGLSSLVADWNDRQDSFYNEVVIKFADGIIDSCDLIAQTYPPKNRIIFWQLADGTIKGAAMKLLESAQSEEGSQVGDVGEILNHIDQRIHELTISCLE